MAAAEIEADVVATVVAALDGDQADACLEAAIGALRARGLAEPDGEGEAWLVLRRGERELRLWGAAGVAPPGAHARALLGHALGAALARAAERDEARTAKE